MTLSRALIMLGAFALLVGAPLAAQELSAARVGIAPAPVAGAGPPRAALEVAAAAVAPRRRWPFVLYGAAVGAIAGGLLLANRIAHEQDPLLIPRHTVVYVGVGAGLGALGGWALSGADWWPSGAAERRHRSRTVTPVGEPARSPDGRIDADL